MAGGLAIVLSGGGAKGAFQVGALKALISGKKVNFETGVVTSTGAIQAAAVAQNDIPALVKFWTDLKGPDDVYKSRGEKLFSIITCRASVYTHNALPHTHPRRPRTCCRALTHAAPLPSAVIEAS